MRTAVAEMTWPDLADCTQFPEIQLQEADSAATMTALAILPVGALEPHGPHLPLASDALLSETLAAFLAEDLTRKKEGQEPVTEAASSKARPLVLPSIGYGVATPALRLGGDFPGVINIAGSTLTLMVGDILRALLRHGITRVVLLNSAIDNLGFLCEAARVVRDDAPDLRVMVVHWWDVVGEPFRDELAVQTGTPRERDHHAGMVESSLVMAVAPDLCSNAPPREQTQDVPARRVAYHVFPAALDTLTPTGVVYDAHAASAELGSTILARVRSNLATAVRHELL